MSVTDEHRASPQRGHFLGAVALQVTFGYALAAIALSFTGMRSGWTGAPPEQRALWSYAILFGLHALNSAIDHAIGAHSALRGWTSQEQPLFGDYQWYFGVHHAFWVITHSAFGVAGSFELYRARRLAADATTSTPAPLANGAAEMALQTVLVAVWFVGFAHIGRCGVSQPLPSQQQPRPVGLLRLTDNPIFALLLAVCLLEAARGSAFGAARGESRALSVGLPLLIAAWVLVGGSHQNIRFGGRQWLKVDHVRPAFLRAALCEVFSPLSPRSLATACSGVAVYHAAGLAGVLLLGMAINVVTALAFHGMVAAAVLRARGGPPAGKTL